MKSKENVPDDPLVTLLALIWEMSTTLTHLHCMVFPSGSQCDYQHSQPRPDTLLPAIGAGGCTLCPAMGGQLSVHPIPLGHTQCPFRLLLNQQDQPGQSGEQSQGYLRCCCGQLLLGCKLQFLLIFTWKVCGLFLCITSFVDLIAVLQLDKSGIHPVDYFSPAISLASMVSTHVK